MASPHIAIQTLRAFEDAVAYDGGNTFRMWLGRVIPHIGDAYRTDDSPFRTHMGASTIGRACAREIWYSFRWATRTKASGRMLRLWNRGHMEEARFIALLLTIGCEVIQQDESGKQYRISVMGGHYGGSGDGMAERIPDVPHLRLLTEFKTHSSKSFNKLAGSNWAEYADYHIFGKTQGVKQPPAFEGDGVRGAKPEHYVQMQQYMHHMKLAAGLYCAVNKDNDHIYAELIPLDTESAERYTHRAIEIIPLHSPPQRINKSPSWFECKFCDHRQVCHFGAEPERNCRTCTYSEPLPNGTWFCHHHVGPLDKATQLQGCSFYSKNTAAFK